MFLPNDEACSLGGAKFPLPLAASLVEFPLEWRKNQCRLSAQAAAPISRFAGASEPLVGDEWLGVDEIWMCWDSFQR